MVLTFDIRKQYIYLSAAGSMQLPTGNRWLLYLQASQMVAELQYACICSAFTDGVYIWDHIYHEQRGKSMG